MLVGGCGDDGVTGEVGSLLDTYCDAAFRCCNRGEVDYLLGPFTDEGNCKERLRNSAELSGASGNLPGDGPSFAVFNLRVLERAVDDGRVELNSGNLDACRRLIREGVCNQEPEEAPEGCVPPEPVEVSPCDLDQLFRGQVAEGGECSSPGTSFECKDGLTCAQVSSLGVLGACVKPGDVGDFCFSDNECDEELYCSLVDGTCQERRLEGEACAFADSDDPSPPASTLLIKCVEGLSCDPVSETCVAPCSRGASCFADGDCDEEEGLSCISGRCDVPRAIGQPCGGSNEDCQEGLRCALNPAEPAQLICQPRIGNDESCLGFSDDDCESGFCNNSEQLCKPSFPPGSDCPSFDSAECAGGYCDTTPLATNCTLDDQCPGTCNTLAGFCFPVCLALAADGVDCTSSLECASGACVDLVCRTLPLADGVPCTFSGQCESQFCNTGLIEPLCQTLPLANGTACSSNLQCDSEVCFGGECVNGLSEGADCTSAIDPPCSKLLYCDRSLTPAACVPKLPAGSECDSTDQCFGSCSVRFARLMCDTTPPPERLTCDGEGE
ncbi:MAG: hypothetical protein KJO07_10365 [Deltaproteobacteria bacterium]|nr:hypothetical protein [Deltaproteobacteria bacterium]